MIVARNTLTQVPTLNSHIATFTSNGPSGPSSGTVLVSGNAMMDKSNEQQGWRDTDFRLKIQNRQNASLGYTRRATKITPGSFLVTYSSWYDHYPGYYTTRQYVSKNRYSPDVSSYISEGLDSDLDQIALKRLKAKLQKQTGQINALVPIAEARELGGLVKAAAFSALDMTKALIDIKRTKGRSAYQFASHAWLTWSFAIAPTLSEIENVKAAIAKFLEPEKEPMYYASGNSYRKSHSTINFYDTFEQGSGSRNDKSSVLLREEWVRYKTGFKVPVKSANNYGLSDQLGFEWSNLPATLWELTAFSWLFDYFTTAGEFIDDTFSGDGVFPVYCDRTHKVRHTFVLDFDIPPNSHFGDYNGGLLSWMKEGDPTIVESLYMNRSPFGNTIPSRAFRFRSQNEIAKNAINKLLNLGSILAGGKAFSSKVSRL